MLDFQMQVSFYLRNKRISRSQRADLIEKISTRRSAAQADFCNSLLKRMHIRLLHRGSAAILCSLTICGKIVRLYVKIFEKPTDEFIIYSNVQIFATLLY